MTIVELKQSVDSTLLSLEKLRIEKGEEEDDWLKQVSKTDGGEICWPGKDGHFLRCLRSKRQLVGGRQMEKEIEAFEMSKYEYLTAIIDDIRRRFLNLSTELQDFLVLHTADQDDTEERLMSLMNHINKPGLTFESLLKQWKLWEPILRENPISDSDSLRRTVHLAIKYDTEMLNIPDIRMLYTMYILLPLSTASCERGFSCMNYIKSKRRNKLLENTLRYCIIISNHRWSEGALDFRSIADEINKSLRYKVEPKEHTLDELMEELESKKKKKKKAIDCLTPVVAAVDNKTSEVDVEELLTKSLTSLKNVDVDAEGKLRQNFNVEDQMLWGETVDGCIQSSRATIGKINEEHTIVTPVNALWVLADPASSGISDLQGLLNWKADIKSHDIHAWFEGVADLFNIASYMCIYMPLCVRNSHYVTVVLQKLVTGETRCYILDSTGRENFFSACRQKTVELLYAFLETTRLKLNPVNTHTIDRDEGRIRAVQEELERVASMPLTTPGTVKITELAKKLELLNSSLRPEITWLEGIEQDGSFECGLAVAGNIALFERVTEAGQFPADDNFTKICRIMPNAYGGVGYSRAVGFPALVEACSLGLGGTVKSENREPIEQTCDATKALTPSEKIQPCTLSCVTPMIPSSKSSRKRKLRQTNLLSLFNTPSKKVKHDYKNAL